MCSLFSAQGYNPFIPGGDRLIDRDEAIDRNQMARAASKLPVWGFLQWNSPILIRNQEVRYTRGS